MKKRLASSLVGLVFLILLLLRILTVAFQPLRTIFPMIGAI